MNPDLDQLLSTLEKNHPELVAEIKERRKLFPHRELDYLKFLQKQWLEDGGKLSELPSVAEYAGIYPLPADLHDEHFCKVAATGAGKTVSTYMEASNLMQNQSNIIVPDWKGDYLGLALEHPALVVRPNELRINILERHAGESSGDVAIRLGRNMREAFYLRDMSENILLETVVAAHEKYQNPTVFHMMKDLALREHNPRERSFLAVETIMNRLRRLTIELPDAFSCSRGFNLDFFLNNSIVLHLKGISTYVAIFLINHILQLVMKFKKPSHNRIVFILEEGHIFLGRERESRYDLGEVFLYSCFRMGRALKVGFYLISQTIAFSPAVLGNCNTVMIGRLLSDS